MTISSQMSQIMLQFPFIDLFNTLLFLLPLLTILRKLSKSKQNNPKLPPGPWKLPIIGNLHQMALGGSLPHYSLRDLAKKHGHIVQLKLGEVLAVLISSPEAAREVLQTQDLVFAQRPHTLPVEVISRDHPGIISSPHNDYWRQMRKICVTELLSVKRVLSFKSIREEETWNMIESIYSSNGSPINLSKMIFSATNSVLYRAAFGDKCKGLDEFVSTINDLSKYGTRFNLVDLFPSLKFLAVVTGVKPGLERLFKRLDKVLGDIIDDHVVKAEQKGANSGFDEPENEDLVYVLLRLQKSNELKFEFTTKHIKGVLLDMCVAGGETGGATIEWAMAELLKNPRVMKKAQEEARQVLQGKTKFDETDAQKLNYLKCVIKETLRLHPPAPVSARQAKEPREVFGYKIPKNTKIFINLWALGRDPRHWDNAESFEPERFLSSSVDFFGTNFEFVPFGAGRRMCPGISFAIPNVEFALARLLYHFDWKLASGEKSKELELTETFSATSRIKNNLNLISTPFVPLII